jgi:hypothetical protein
MRAKPLCYAHKVLFRNIFYFENMFINSLKHCSEYLIALGNCLIWIETFCKRFGNKSEIRKQKRRKKRKIRIGPPGKPFGPTEKRAHGPAGDNPEPVSLLLSSSHRLVGPTGQSSSSRNHPPSFLSGYWKRPPLLPSSMLINACPFRRPAHTYK